MDAIGFMWKGGYTKRYHTQRTLVEDTVGHHSFNVGCIIMHIWPEARAELLKAALLHDVAEHVMGDMPAPAKRALPDYVDHMNDGEAVSFREVFGQQEEGFMAAAGIAYPALYPDEEWVLKIADSLDGMRFCCQERAMGNRFIDEVYGNFRDYVEALLLNPPAEVQLSVLTQAASVFAGLKGVWNELFRK